MIKTIEDLEKCIDELETENIGWEDGEGDNPVYMPKEMMIELMIRAFIEYIKNKKEE